MRGLIAGALALVVAACNPSTAKSGIAYDDATTSPAPVAAAASTPEASAPRARVRVVEAAEDADALSLVRSKRLEAKAEARVLVVYVSATWCEPCKRLKAELESGRLDERLANVTLLAFDADRDSDRLGAAGYSYRFVPFVALPGVDGRPVDAQQATGRGSEAWRELLGKLDAWQRGAVPR